MMKAIAAVVLMIVLIARQAQSQDVPIDQKLKDMQEEIDELAKSNKALKEVVDSNRPGTTRFVLTGYGAAGYVDAAHSNSTFQSSFNPIFMWKLDDRLFFEGELELKVAADQTETGLEYADVTYVLSDYVILGAGKFLNPSNYFMERLHPAWINKFPDRPLAFGAQGLMAEGEIGVQTRGAIPFGSTSLQYALYVSNGPRLMTDTPEGAGLISPDAFLDNNNGKAVGGRIGYRPLDGMEFGYGLESGRAGASGDPNFADVDALIQSVDFNYVRDVSSLGGQIDLRGQWIWSHIGKATYDPSGSLGFGPVSFDNRSNGGYVQLAYRPTGSQSAALKNMEAILRFDRVNPPGGDPFRFDETRWTIGLDYWLGSSSVFKLAYELDDKSEPGLNSNAFLAQFAIGF